MSTARAYRDQANVPAGMGEYRRWFTPFASAPKVSPADIDGYLHHARTNRWVMLEFKPAGSELTTGQRISLEGFSKLPGCVALAVFDPHAHDRSGTPYDANEELRVVRFAHGVAHEHTTTVARLNGVLEAWWDRTGGPLI